MKTQRTIHIAIVLLLSTIFLWTIEATPGESNGEQSKNNIGITRLIDVISISTAAEKTRRAEVDQAIAELRAMGDEAIEPLMDELRRSQNANLQHRVVSLLQSIGTSKARESLLRIAHHAKNHLLAFYVKRIASSSISNIPIIFPISP